MTDFHLIRPWWLLALALLPALYLASKRYRNHGLNWQQLVPEHLQAAMLMRHQDQHPSRRSQWPWWLAALCMLALSGPSWTRLEVPVFQLNQGRVIVMDMSYSMYATDLTPNRLTQSRFKAIDLIRSFDEGETGLIAYAGDAFTLAPMTDDKQTLLNLIPTLSPEIMPVPGSDLPSALELASTLLKDAGYHKGEIILFIDGINDEHASRALELAQSQPWNLKVYVLGTDAGAPMRRSDGKLVKNRAGEVIVAQANTALLNKLADAGNGRLIPFRAGDQDIATLAAPLHRQDQSKHTQQQQRSTDQWQDMGIYLLPLLLLPAAWFARRYLPLLMLSLLVLPPAPADAAWWQSSQSQANELMRQGQHQQAADLLPDGSQKAEAYYRSNQFEQALTQYQQLPQSARSLYNQGNALARLNQLKPAQHAYEQALALNPKLEAAQANLQLVKQLQEQQQKQQQAGDGDQGQEGQQDQNQQPGDQDGQEQTPPSDNQSQQSQDQSQNSNQSQGQSASDDQSQSAPDSDPQGSPPRPELGDSHDSGTGARQPDGQAPPAPAPLPPSDDAQPSQTREEFEAASEGANDTSSPDQAHPQGRAAADGPSDTEQQEPPASIDARTLERIQDDPSLLLRNKMKLEYERRRRAGQINEERTQW
ncbi:Ca-activated chloride channel family protein [Ferrimonas sediminum]|uniref:Ca-activated chloride channel family protein n=1 Tax=Ferrimonas sediminum TaxID=718193 RepID=A0A1G8LAA6_9GAMM|nr:VWA domain-containing protein [Ferrimonas sediminum]SDI52601.1 Ca-activated chloride channel family protein [Ferrimonas sediminum]